MITGNETLRAHSPGPGRTSHGPAEGSETFPICIATAAASRVENVLQWSTFGGQIPTDDILAPVFANRGGQSEDGESEDGDGHAWSNGRHDMEHHDGSHQHENVRGRKEPTIFDEKMLGQPPGEIGVLVQRFFRNVHTKNPILDSNVLDRCVREVEQQGAFGWSGKSCLLVRITSRFRPMFSNRSLAASMCPRIHIGTI